MLLDGNGDTIVACGCSKSGKTWLIRALLRSFGRNFQSIVIMTGSSFSKDWEPLGIRPVEISRERLETFIEIAKRQAATGTPGKFLLVCDDMQGTLKSTKGGPFAKLATMGRHLGISTIFLTQHLKFVASEIRGNVSHFFVMANQVPMTIAGIHEICGMNKDEFSRSYDRLSQYDFVHVTPVTRTVIFSRKLERDVFEHRKLVSPTDTISARIAEQTSVFLQSEERARQQMYLQFPGGTNDMSATHQNYGDPTESSSAASVVRTPSAYNVPSAYVPAAVPAPYLPPAYLPASVPAQPAAATRERQDESSVGGGFLGGWRASAVPTAPYEPPVPTAPDASPPAAGPIIRSNIL